MLNESNFPFAAAVADAVPQLAPHAAVEVAKSAAAVGTDSVFGSPLLVAAFVVLPDWSESNFPFAAAVEYVAVAPLAAAIVEVVENVAIVAEFGVAVLLAAAAAFGFEQRGTVGNGCTGWKGNIFDRFGRVGGCIEREGSLVEKGKGFAG
jgi:hypothetical protein